MSVIPTSCTFASSVLAELKIKGTVIHESAPVSVQLYLKVTLHSHLARSVDNISNFETKKTTPINFYLKETIWLDQIGSQMFKNANLILINRFN